MFNQLFLEMLDNVSPTNLKTIVKKLKKQKKRNQISNVKMLRKILEFFKIKNEIMSFIFGISDNKYQNKLLSLAFDLCDWYIQKSKQTLYPKMSVDKTLTSVFTQFNKIQEEQEEEWKCFDDDDDDDDDDIKPSKIKIKPTNKADTKADILKSIESDNE